VDLTENTIRLDKYLSSQGIASRRNVSHFLKTNLVVVNDNKAEKSGLRIDPKKDKITINGESVKKPILEYWILNKPKGVISTAKDENERETVVSLVKSTQRLFPVGRLDKSTTGLIILTNDGDLTNKITHPRYHLAKTYQAEIAGKVPLQKLEMIKNGVPLEDGTTAPAKAKVLKENPQSTLLEITLFEGKNRQIRRMCQALLLSLYSLERISIGPIKLKNLKQGVCRQLTKKELFLLKKATGD